MKDTLSFISPPFMFDRSLPSRSGFRLHFLPPPCSSGSVCSPSMPAFSSSCSTPPLTAPIRAPTPAPTSTSPTTSLALLRSDFELTFFEAPFFELPFLAPPFLAPPFLVAPPS